MKILVTGASSLPGYRFVREALGRGHEVIGLHYSNPIPIENEKLTKIRLDIRDIGSLSDVIVDERPDVIVHMATLGKVDQCEQDRDLAWSVTARPSIAIASIAEKVGAFPVYLSTDYVFDGISGGYREEDPPAPINYYGLVKLVGEIAFQSIGEGYAIVRASSIYGLGPGRMNFAKFLIMKLQNNEEVKALIDQYTTPTQATLLAKALMEIIERRLTGIFHVVGERLSRYDFAIKVSDKLGLDRTLIRPAKMEEMRWIAKRPKDSSLNCEKTKKILKTEFHSMEYALETLKMEYEEERSR